MEERDFQRWSRRRAKGERHYVLFWGVLFWGMTCFVGTTFLFREPPDFMPGVVGFVIWAFGGYVFGRIMWRFSEEKFLKEYARRSGEKAFED